MKSRAGRNRSITLTDDERKEYSENLVTLTSSVDLDAVVNKLICGDIFTVLDYLPANSVDLIFADPPYNLDKQFNTTRFENISLAAYTHWLDSWLGRIDRLLKPTGSLYICGDWRSSLAIFQVCERYWRVQTRITWEREKGRGAKHNWKNCSEDIWFCTKSRKFTFNPDAVKLRRRVIAPYSNSAGEPKDWQSTPAGRFRDTYPSNLWTDITVPYWSMPENTEHPTQKPEKLLAKIVLASSNVNDVVFDPFLGSGTTAVVASKLGRRFLGVELDEYYCCVAQKRLQLAKENMCIQGFADNVFWERNTMAHQRSAIHQKSAVGLKSDDKQSK